MNKAFKLIIIIGVTALLLGAGIFTAALAAGGWNVKNIAEPEYIYREFFGGEEQILSVTIDYKYADVTVEGTEGDELYISYPVDKEEKGEVSLSVENGEVRLSEIRTRSALEGFSLANLAHPPVVTVRLPKCFKYDLNLSTLNGEIKIFSSDEMQFGRIKAITENGVVTLGEEGKICTAEDIAVESSNGAISAFGARADDIRIISGNGSITVTDCSAVREFGIKTSNGAIAAAKVDAKDFSAKTSNGSIAISFTGNGEDYALSARTGLGSCNVEDRAEGAKRVALSTSLGSIKVTFNA